MIEIAKPNKYQHIIDKWHRVRTISYGSWMTCGVLVEIYQHENEFCGTVHVSAGDHGNGFGVPFMEIHEPRFPNADAASAHYLKRAVEHVKANTVRGEDIKLKNWLLRMLDKNEQMEIDL